MYSSHLNERDRKLLHFYLRIAGRGEYNVRMSNSLPPPHHTPTAHQNGRPALKQTAKGTLVSTTPPTQSAAARQIRNSYIKKNNTPAHGRGDRRMLYRLFILLMEELVRSRRLESSIARTQVALSKSATRQCDDFAAHAHALATIQRLHQEHDQRMALLSTQREAARVKAVVAEQNVLDHSGPNQG